MIDLHCHILPGLDDGPSTLDESLALAGRAVELGTRTVVATPHVSWLYPFDPLTVRPAVEGFRRALADAAIDLEVASGGELALTRLTSLDDSQLRSLCLGNGRHLLVNSPYSPMSGLLEDVLADLQTRGFRPILAHPERCPSFHADPDRLMEIAGHDVLLSITAGSLVGDFGARAGELARRLFAAGLVHNVASDAHGERERPPGLGEGIDGLGAGAREVEWLVNAVPAAVLAGDELPPRPRFTSESPRHPRLAVPTTASGPAAAESEPAAPDEHSGATTRATAADRGCEPASSAPTSTVTVAPAAMDGTPPEADTTAPGGERGAATAAPVGVDRAHSTAVSAGPIPASPVSPSPLPAAPLPAAPLPAGPVPAVSSPTHRRGRALVAAATTLVAVTVLALVLLLASRSGSVDRARSGAGGTGSAAGASASIPVISFGPRRDGDAMAREDLTARVDALAAAGFTAIDAATFLAFQGGRATALPRKPMLLTFDQRPGTVAAADSALARHDFRGVLFAATGRVGSPGSVSWAQLLDLERSGRWDFGSRARVGTSTVAVDSQGKQRAFLLTPRWLRGEARVETDAEYRARVGGDLQASVDDFVSRGLDAPRLFAFSDSSTLPPEDGLPVPPALREALFSRFDAAMVDTEPPAAYTRGVGGYVPRIRAARSGSPDDLVRALDAAVATAGRRDGGHSALAERRRAVGGWAAAVRAGDFERAAEFFAPGAVVAQTGERILTSRAAAVRFNRRLPCRAEVQEVRGVGGQTAATFRLLPGRDGGCAQGGVAQVRLVIRAGKFLEWRQVLGARAGAV